MLVRFESLAEIFPLHHDSLTHFVKPRPHRFADSPRTPFLSTDA